MSDKSVVWVVVAVIGGVLLLCVAGVVAVLLFGFTASQQPMPIYQGTSVRAGELAPEADLDALAASYDDEDAFEAAVSTLADGLSGGRFVVAYIPAGGDVTFIRNDGFGPHELAWLDGVVEEVDDGSGAIRLTTPTPGDLTRTQVKTVQVAGSRYAVVVASQLE